MEAIALFGGFGFCVLVGWLAFSRVGTWMESDAMQEVYRRETCGTIYVPVWVQDFPFPKPTE